MNIEKIHVPQRLEGESQVEYRSRQRMSKRLAQRTTLIHGIKAGPARVNANPSRSKLIKAVGVRQAKKAIREARAQQFQAGLD